MMNLNPFRPRILAEPSNNAGRAPAMPSGRRRSGVTIGSKHTGKTQGVTDVAAGTYWEALPLINGDALRWQRLLLAPLPEPRRPKDVKVRVDFVLDPTTGVMRADA